MRARAWVVVTAGADGRSVCSRLRSDPPLTLRQTLDGVHLVGSGAGPLGGDDLALAVAVEAGAELRLAAVAASLAMPGPNGAPSRFALDVDVGPGGALRLLGAPLVLVAGCDHHVDVRIRLGRGAALVWRDEVVLGRHDEPSGSLRQRVAVDLDDRPLWRSELAVGPRSPGFDGPAVLAGARAVGSLLLVGAAGAPGATMPPVGGARAAASPLDGPATLVTALATSGGRLAAALDAVRCEAQGPWARPSPTSSPSTSPPSATTAPTP